MPTHDMATTAQLPRTLVLNQQMLGRRCGKHPNYDRGVIGCGSACLQVRRLLLTCPEVLCIAVLLCTEGFPGLQAAPMLAQGKLLHRDQQWHT